MSEPTNMLVYYPALGDIVALHSHPFRQNQTDIIIAGEHQLLPPLMVVAEISKDTKTLFDEKTSDEISRIGFGQCKCIWFSHKSNQFEEALISSKLLKLIERQEDKIDKDKLYEYIQLDDKKPNEPKFKKYFNVAFKSSDIELSKRKSTMTCDESSIIDHNEEKYTISACLSFVSPVMEIIQIIDSKEVEQKEGRFNSKTGERKKIVSDWMVKCKWFNPASDKYSEKTLPIDVLKIVIPVNEKLLKTFREAIAKFKKIPIEPEYFKLFDDKLKELTIVRPKAIVYKGGEYLLKAYSYLTNNVRYIKINQESYVSLDSYSKEKVPTFKYIEEGILTEDTTLNEKIKAVEFAIGGNYLVRLKYENSQDKATIRTIRNLEIKPVEEKDGTVLYLRGYCLLKQEIRTFKMTKILKLEVLDLRYSK